MSVKSLMHDLLEAHIDGLEERIWELESENEKLTAALNTSPSIPPIDNRAELQRAVEEGLSLPINPVRGKQH